MDGLFSHASFNFSKNLIFFSNCIFYAELKSCFHDFLWFMWLLGNNRHNNRHIGLSNFFLLLIVLLQSLVLEEVKVAHINRFLFCFLVFSLWIGLESSAMAILLSRAKGLRWRTSMKQEFLKLRDRWLLFLVFLMVGPSIGLQIYIILLVRLNQRQDLHLVFF